MTERSPHARERGAAAVELALVLPLLLTLLLGIIEFGRIYNAQIIFTNAAREAARTMAIKDDPDLARQAALDVAAGYAVTVDPGICVPEDAVHSTVDGSIALISGSWFDFGPVNLRGVGEMRCGG